MKKYKWPLILLNLVVVMALFIGSVINKEKTLRDGQLVLLELAPVDPRSLLQGDYMDLRYAIAQDERLSVKPARTGYFVVRPDEQHVAGMLRVQNGQTPLQPGELLIAYKRTEAGGIYLGAESYFFEEGLADTFARARFGGLKVDKDGKSILVGLYDEQHNLLKSR